jgi:branched-chain amino acid transport system substrate-binding protein
VKKPALRNTTAAYLALLLCAVACSGGGNTPTAPKTITIGVDLPLTGPGQRAGQSTLNGVRFFVQRHQVLDGFNITIDARDDAGATSRDPSRGAANLQAFIANPQVLAVIGPFDSNIARAQIPVANRAHLAMVSPTTSSRCLTKEPFLPAGLNPSRSAIACKAAGLPSPADLRPTRINNYFRLSTTDDLQGAAAADYASRGLHLHRVALVSDNEAYGQGLADSFSARFTRLGGTVVASREIDPRNPLDLTNFLEQAKQSGAQGLYYGGSSAGGGCVVRAQMAGVFGAGEATPFFGGDGIALDPTCVRDAGGNAAGIYATVPTLDAEQTATAKPVIQAFHAAFGRSRDFGPFTMAAYDATGAVYDALDRAIKAERGNRPFRDEVVSGLGSPATFQGVTGTFGFDAEGDTSRRTVTIYKPVAATTRMRWTWVETVDYSAALPY